MRASKIPESNFQVKYVTYKDSKDYFPEKFHKLLSLLKWETFLIRWLVIICTMPFAILLILLWLITRPIVLCIEWFYYECPKPKDILIGRKTMKWLKRYQDCEVEIKRAQSEIERCNRYETLLNESDSEYLSEKTYNDTMKEFWKKRIYYCKRLQEKITNKLLK